MKKILLAVCALALVFVLAACDAVKNGEVVAKVNGKVITMAELNAELENLPQQYKMFGVDRERKKQVLENLVAKELLMQEADKEGISTKPEVVKKIKEAEVQLKSTAEQELAKLEKQKKDAAMLAKKDVVINELLKNKDYKEISVSELEILTAYKDYAKRMKGQDPKAKIPALKEMKDNIKTYLARQKWFDSLKAAANIIINEDKLGPAAPPTGMQINPAQMEAAKAAANSKKAPVKPVGK